MKRLLTILVAGLLIATLTAPAFAWEFAMTGEFELRYRYISRTGPSDLFGNADIAQAQGIIGQRSTIGLSGPVVNYAPFSAAAGTSGTALSVQVEGYSVMGSDAAFLEQRAEFYPEVRVNPAVRWRGTYALQGNLNGPYTSGSQNWADNPFYSPWITMESRGSATQKSAFAVGVWRHSWLTAQTPWGIIAAGYRPGPFGIGLLYGDKDINTNSVTIVAPYGPLTVMWGIYKGPGIAYTDPGSVAGSDPGFDSAAAGHQLVALMTDQNLTRNINFYAAFTYRNGPVDTGVLWRHLQHQGTHGAAYPAALAPSFRNDQNPDLGGLTGGTFLNVVGGVPMYTGNEAVVAVNPYFKYNNGRFFFNAEFAQEYVEVFRSGGRPVSGNPYGWVVELGALCGPSKVTFFHWLKTGQDRRGGVFAPTSAIGTFGAAQVADKFEGFVSFTGSTSALRPYTYLLDLYGTGSNDYNNYGETRYNDFVAYAGRVDYAVAANLNLWGSYIYAMRQSNTATRMGQFNGFTGATLSGIAPRAASSATTAVPNIPDNYLGWEADFGVDWKLLEGLTFKGLFAYWQPGPWFPWAYVDQSTGTTTTVGGITTNISPNRGIDALIGVQGSLLMEF
ncbi:MAG: hypothetical protein HY913_15685 [Desulfomonile tiedjei]|nr:hypothetical protein [Desulfomonile tiedjei]